MKLLELGNNTKVALGLGLTVLLLSCASNDRTAEKQSSESSSAKTSVVPNGDHSASTAAYTSMGKAPGFEIQDLSGKVINWNQYEGKLVLVDFWATWCGPCRRSIPHLAELHKKYQDKGFEVVGISLDRSDKADVADFAKQMGIPYTVLMGSMKLASDWGVGAGIPVAFLVDRKGDIVDKFIGYHESGEYEQEIQKFL